MADPHPRYVLTKDGLHVLDRWYCYWEVYRTSWHVDAEGAPHFPPFARAIARKALDKLNAEHDAWLVDESET